MPPRSTIEERLAYAREVIETEARAVRGLAVRIDESFAAAVDLVLACPGRVVVTGMGKPGLVATKISATLASTGTASHFLHPAEALHGDLGRIRADDVLIVLSNSGETEEILRLLPPIKKIGSKIVAITGRAGSTLARHADVVLDMGDISEACPLGLAPSASTTAMLALGDAIALTVQKARNFSPEEYAFYHPGGALGRKLMRVREVMRTGAAAPTIAETGRLRDALIAITRARAGSICVVDGGGLLAGIFTDGDLRRLLERRVDLEGVDMKSVMTARPKSITDDRLATEALRVLKANRIDELPVVDGAGRPVGLVDVQDLLAVGLV